HHRPFRRRGACRHPLRDAAARALRRHRDLPRLVRPLQHPRGGRRSGAGIAKSAGIPVMTEDVTKDDVKTAASAPDTATGAEPAAAGALPQAEINRLTDEIVASLKTVYDPEIPADVYELGLIYKIDIADDRKVAIDMTLTTPNCPSAQELPAMVENAVASVPGVGPVEVNVVWDPPWEPS